MCCWDWGRNVGLGVFLASLYRDWLIVCSLMVYGCVLAQPWYHVQATL